MSTVKTSKLQAFTLTCGLEKNAKFLEIRKKEFKISHRFKYRGVDKSLARPGRKQARKRVRDARDFDNIETRLIIKLFLLQGKAPKEIHVIPTETLACFLPGRAKDLSAPLYIPHVNISQSHKT